MLAIETSTEACSVALFDGVDLVAHSHEVLGRGHAERLVPMIADLPNKGRADEILVGLGPGSFTGTRIGLATARALGVAWGATVRGFPSLALVAAQARAQHPGPVSVCMAGGHGEWLLQDFTEELVPQSSFVSLPPGMTRAGWLHRVIAGNKAAEKAAEAGGSQQALELLPDARFVTALPAVLLTDRLAPLYARAPDATPHTERR